MRMKWQPSDNERFAMAIVHPEQKKHYVEILKNKGAAFLTLQAPWVFTSSSIKCGEGCIIAAYSIKRFARISSFVTIYQSMLADTIIGSYSSVMAYANTTNATIGELAYIGNNAAIMLDLNIGDGAYVCDNSIVVKDVKPGMIVSGIPARKMSSGRKW